MFGGMDEWIKQGQWWWLFAVPIATGLLAVFGSFLGTRFGKSAEHQQWVRDQKMKFYTEYLQAAGAFLENARGRRTEGDDQFFRTFASQSTAFITPDKVRPHYEKHWAANLDMAHHLTMVARRDKEPDSVEEKRLQDEHDAALDALREAFRKDLKFR